MKSSETAASVPHNTKNMQRMTGTVSVRDVLRASFFGVMQNTYRQYTIFQAKSQDKNNLPRHYFFCDAICPAQNDWFVGAKWSVARAKGAIKRECVVWNVDKPL